MSKIPEKLLYLETHEWVRFENEKAYVGITDYAQDQLGDVVFVELPAVGEEFQAKSGIAVVESVKAASDIYAPISGTVVEVNEALEDNPQLVNEDPYGEGWMVVLTVDNEEEIKALLSAEDYGKILEEEA
ncbi:MAG TPA: glycine cleavage system protein GcvH [Firmicutes bacterium]|jgi:glycine cleavage system H protein|nr:glycine cleavage system protein GcvH [Bacillota bacterium]